LLHVARTENPAAPHPDQQLWRASCAARQGREIRVMPVHKTDPMSRRALLPLLAAAPLSPALFAPSAVRAQGAWQIYRPESAGFEIEMPGEPKAEVINHERDYPAVKSINAHVDIDDISFGADYVEYRIPITLQEATEAQQLVARSFPAQMSVTAFTMNGIEGSNIVMDSDKLNAMQRLVIVKNNRQILVSVIGERSIYTNALVRRFLDSFKLLPEN
jgi:hypothetical protein